jgi:hypothetical protein
MVTGSEDGTWPILTRLFHAVADGRATQMGSR